MTKAHAHHLIRRLPVFFLLDTSAAMAGVFEVTVQQGLHMLKNELYRHPICQYTVHLSVITFGGTHISQGLVPLRDFTLAGWQAGGKCSLRPAFLSLAEAFRYDLIFPGPTRLGDYKPIVFLILGERPGDSWQDAYTTLKTYPGGLQPLIVTLVTRQRLARELKVLGGHTLLLAPAEGECMTNFFTWAASTISTICESCEHGEANIHFPALPYGVVTTT